MRRKKMGYLRRTRSGTLPFVRRFRMREVEAATNGFTSAVAGATAEAYRARFAGGLVATVRRASSSSGEEELGTADEFRTEVQLLGRLNHRHVVGLRGFAEGRRNRFLVFDHAEGGRSLKECLHDPLRTPLDWRTRLQVAIDIAAALEYLYYFCDPPVFHVSVSSSDVVLDADFVAKLSDVSVISRDIKRATTAAATESSQDEVEQRRRDLVFRYGVLLLELVTGQSPGAVGEDGELVRWVQEPGFAGSMHRMVDADLGDAYDAGELRSLVVLARICTRTRRGGGGGGDDEHAGVVSMPRIVRYLQGKVERLGCRRTRCGG